VVQVKNFINQIREGHYDDDVLMCGGLEFLPAKVHLARSSLHNYMIVISNHIAQSVEETQFQDLVTRVIIKKDDATLTKQTSKKRCK
jgi:hypothetical protein